MSIPYYPSDILPSVMEKKARALEENSRKFKRITTKTIKRVLEYVLVNNVEDETFSEILEDLSVQQSKGSLLIHTDSVESLRIWYNLATERGNKKGSIGFYIVLEDAIHLPVIYRICVNDRNCSYNIEDMHKVANMVVIELKKSIAKYELV